MDGRPSSNAKKIKEHKKTIKILKKENWVAFLIAIDINVAKHQL